MKKIVLCAVTIAICFCNSCSDPNNVDENPVGFQWQTSTPDQLGLNSSMLNTALSTASSMGFINSIVVIRNGKIAAEQYFNGRNINSHQTVRSVSKSFLSALVGIAVNKGILHLDQKVSDSFPEYISFVTDTNINNITLKHLITMRSGIKGDVEFYFTFTQSGNWVKTILQSQLNFMPGTRSLYSTASTHLISGMLTKASGMSGLDFAKTNLLDPMGIVLNDWATDPQGICFGGNDMYFTTRNMAALGLLYLNNGKLNDKQIVPEDWINNSLVYSGGIGGTWGSLSEIGYGYMWWLGKVSGKRIFTALGHGGQYVLCVPDFNMIVAVTSDPYLDWDISDQHERAVMQIIADYIIPAVIN